MANAQIGDLKDLINIYFEVMRINNFYLMPLIISTPLAMIDNCYTGCHRLLYISDTFCIAGELRFHENNSNINYEEIIDMT